jgi:hypothetical protein
MIRSTAKRENEGSRASSLESCLLLGFANDEFKQLGNLLARSGWRAQTDLPRSTTEIAFVLLGASASVSRRERLSNIEPMSYSC